MAKQTLPATTHGDLRSKANANFDELYGGLAGVTLLDKTADYTVVQADEGKLIRGNAASGAIVFTLPASGSAVGQLMHFRKTDSSANRVTVRLSDAVTDIAWLSSQLDNVEFFWSGTNWIARRWNIAPLLVVFTTPGANTLTKPPLAARIRGILFGGGGGGGGGRCGATASIRSGGGGGGSGATVSFDILASALGSTETVTVGAGGTAGASAGTSAANGGTAGAGGATTLGSLVKAEGGLAGGVGSTAATAAGGIALFSNNLGLAASGGASSTTTTSNPGGISCSAGGGGGGGGRDASDVTRLPGAGGDGSRGAVTTATGGAATGVAGTDVTNTGAQLGGGGGGGGPYGNGANGTSGGNGGAPAGGGAGGGACDVGFTSGAGGAGGRGEFRGTWTFG